MFPLVPLDKLHFYSLSLKNVHLHVLFILIDSMALCWGEAGVGIGKVNNCFNL